jgi:exonuclease III
VEELSAYDADVVALTEYRSVPGAVLGEAMRGLGLPALETTSPTGRQDGIAIFSRTPLRVVRCEERWLEVDLPGYGFHLAVLHIMAAGSLPGDAATVAKKRFWDAVIESAKNGVDRPALLAGDWNTGAHRIDETGRTFVCADRFAGLSALGWTDVWRHHHPGATEWTWHTKRNGVRGNGFRIDHAFATPSLLPRIASCRYSHKERDAGMSDHSMVIVDVE